MAVESLNETATSCGERLRLTPAYIYTPAMQATSLRLALIGISLGCATSCTPINDPRPIAPSPSGQGSNTLSAENKAAIGRKIWQNECGGTIDGLTTWNRGEEFPSLGIGHFIWYPKGFNGRFKESWPAFVAYARDRGAVPPAIAQQRFSPWQSRADFQRHFRDPQLQSLRKWLAAHVTLQTDFIIERSRAALPKILAAADPTMRERLLANYRKVASTPQGTYALIDYVNFKGDGTIASERYNGQGWGLLQVLTHMRNVPSGPAAAREFANSAKRMLARRIANSPQTRGENRWRQGWFNRCDTYAQPL